MVHVARINAVDHISSNPDAAAGDHPDVAGTTKEFFMHDILGGSSPTARPITGLLGSIYSSQVPFARPIGFTIPRGGVPIPNANGDIPTINCNNGIPLRTGLSGTTFSQPTNGPAPNDQRQLGPNGLGLGFGRITVIDDLLTVGPDVGS
ncbi:dirigent protein 16 [Cinnamomum micranthum f. kanehirae]|uniref:Dirigent protein 16 n=1 Tax=Cinnamomum micranthum f. kanehirae TaxID=337451 RepID=A0A3S3MUC3_9MAGN|nr:dirigent protein 16 [Cinnamomum micranthum f. kanehirae]